MESTVFIYVVLPLLIFFARICDVTLGTLRIIFVSKGLKYAAPFLGFFEVLIWVIAISQLLSNLGTWVSYLAYAGGYATGNFVGMRLEEKLAIGTLLVRITTAKHGRTVMQILNSNGFGATLIEGEGSTGKVDIIQTVTSRKHIKKVEKLITQYDSSIFYTVEDVRMVRHGVFPSKPSVLGRWRLGK